jgi:hypothetical protein
MRTVKRFLAITIVPVMVAASARLHGQQIVVTDKITRLDGTWMLEPEKGWGGICGVPVRVIGAFTRLHCSPVRNNWNSRHTIGYCPHGRLDTDADSDWLSPRCACAALALAPD